jgi:hypothetical protein
MAVILKQELEQVKASAKKIKCFNTGNCVLKPECFDCILKHECKSCPLL